MAYTTITDPSAYFQSLLYTGNSSTQSVTFDGNSNLQPDWVWTKCRSNTSDHFLFDTNRGVHKNIHSNDTAAEVDNSNSLTSFDSDGFSMGNVGGMNFNSQTYVGWGWKANGGTTASNTDGTITSTIQANTTAGFSIVTYTGTGSAATIGHGLGVTPDIIIIKTRSNAVDWQVYLNLFGNDDEGLFLNTDSAKFSSTNYWNNGATSSVFGVSNNTGVGANTYTYVAYCFKSIQGYSKIGSYTGNGSGDGPFVYTGFKPAWLMIKRTDASNDWWLIDNKRDDYQNPFSDLIVANTNAVENANTPRGDFLSNGFKWRVSANAFNASGGSYVYMAFAQNPLVATNNVIALAR